MNAIPNTTHIKYGYSVVLGTMLALAAGQEAVSAPLFGPLMNAATGKNPQAVRIADVNQDGRPDLVVGNVKANSVSILFGNGDGSFQAKTDSLVSPTGRSPKSVELGDLNDDGALDLVTANQESRNLSVLLGHGDGTFGPTTWYPTPSLKAHGVAIGDLNRDGKLDVAAAGWESNVLAVRLGRGDGTLAAETLYAAGSEPAAVIIEDFNRDGYKDMANSNYGSRNVSVRLNNGAGGFRDQVLYTAGGAPVGIRAADLDRDGDLDIVTSNDWANNVSVLHGNGDGTFKANVNYATGVKPKYLFIGDVNVDGKPDILAANTNGNFPNLVIPGGDSVSVLLGVGNGTFLAKTDYGVGQGPFQVVTGDLNCDGAPDLVTANYWDANVSIRLNTLGSQVPCGGSVTGP